MTERPLAIAVSSVHKDFRLPSEQRHTLKERVINPRFDADAKVFHALKDVSFDVQRGEFFGIVGRNGSGKSTLLKCMAGIYKLDDGQISIGGRLSTFIELGVGFNPDLAARDNIILNGIMLGLSPKQAASRVDEVIAFAELQDHVDLKLKNYSSGMQVRLAFSVMTQIDADVLLIDEVLAVGDAAFQAKCFDVFRELRAAGKTIVLVTHDMATVARFCDRAMLLEDGEVVAIGAPEEIGDRYLDLNFERRLSPVEEEAEVVEEDPGPELEADANTDETANVFRAKSSPFAVVGAVPLNLQNEMVAHVRTGDTMALAIDFLARRPADLPSVTLELRDEQDNVVFSTTTARAPLPDGAVDDEPIELAADDRWRMGVRFQALLRPGQMRVRAIVRDATGRVLERTGDLARFEVTSVEPVLGIANLPHQVVYDSIDGPFAFPVELLPVGAPTADRS